MRKMILTLAAVAMALPAMASAQVAVKGYVKRDGTYVAPHYRSRPDSNPYNNYSTRPNTNPYTGTTGTRDPSPSLYSPSSPKPKAPCYGYYC